MKRLELTDFQSHIGTVFTFIIPLDTASAENGQSQIATTELKLTSAKPFELSPKDIRATDTSGKYRSVPFSLFFEDSESDYLRQGLYMVNHPGFGESLEFFIVPLGPNPGVGFLYEAAFG